MPIVIPFAGIAIALVVVLFAFAGHYVADAFGRLLSNVPLVGGAIRGVVQIAADSVNAYVLRAWSASLIHLAQAITAPISVIRNVVNMPLSLIREVAITAEWIAGTFVPRMTASAIGYADFAVSALRATTAATFNALATTINNVQTNAFRYADAAAHAVAATTAATFNALATTINNVQTNAFRYAASVGTAVSDWAAQQFNAVLSRVAAQGAQLVQYIDARANQLGQALGVVAATAEAQAKWAATTAVDTTLGILSTDIAGVTAATGAMVTDGVGAAVDAAEGAFDDVLAGVRAIDWAKVTDVAGVAAMTGALATTMTRYLARCGIKNCRNLSGFGDELQGVLGLLGSAELVALFATLVRDPEGGATELIGDVEPLAGAAHSALSVLVGL